MTPAPLEGDVSHPSQDDPDMPLRLWLAAQAVRYHLEFLLAHAEDGVIWGAFRDGVLVTADQRITVAPLPRLRLDRLQQCRAFGSVAELLLWRDADHWSARVIQDSGGKATVHREHLAGRVAEWPDFLAQREENAQAEGQVESLEQHIDEQQILWGTCAEQATGGFTLLADGRQGLRHAVPLDLPESVFDTKSGATHRPVRLGVRHYLAYDKDDQIDSQRGERVATGTARIALSRLTSLQSDLPSTVHA